mmetsp:Transcript_18631/g.74393  ORF Transcript_18631/g.74393 Transcript_18631/m.74393 type:complete len:393 (-) Transcript_18631:59-1237(-)
MDAAASTGSWAFGLRLFAKVAEQTKGNENVFVSPSSITAALRLLEPGTTPGSPQETALKQLLGTATTEEACPTTTKQDAPPPAYAPPRQSTVLASSSVWTRGSIKTSYVEAVKAKYGAHAADLPTTAAPINARIAEETRGFLGDSVVSDAIVADPLVQALLVSAAYFKGSWRTKFDAALTVPDAPFFDAHGKTKVSSCAMMVREFSPQTQPLPVRVLSRDVGATAVALEYGEDDGLTAVFVLPDAGRSVADVAAAFTAAAPRSEEDWASVVRPTTPARRPVRLHVPRFKLSFERNLFPALAAVGGASLGDNGGLLRMADAPDLHLSTLEHHAVVDVNEEGTEAAAAMVAVVKTRSLPLEPENLRFDRPFLFFIEDRRASQLLFAGVVQDPAA